MERAAETNKAIALFMGGTYLPISEHYILPDMVSYLPEDMQYHTSWDWLMPVVGKLTGEIPCQLPEELNGFSDGFHFGLYEADLSKLYNSVVEFIQWYNQKTQ